MYFETTWPRENLWSVCGIKTTNIYRWCLSTFWSWLSTRARWPIFWRTSIHFRWGRERFVGFGCQKGPGPDGIPPTILKNCAPAFAKPLSLLFNRSMETSVFPEGGRFHALLQYSRKVGVSTLKTIVALQYYLQFRSVLNCWFIEEYITTWSI
jgi:hypothetical protein